MRINRFFLLAGFLAFLFSACGEENPAVFPIDSIASEATSSSIQNAEISSSSLATSTLSSSEQTESSSQIILSSSLTVELSSSSVDATSSSSNLSSSGIGPVSFGEMTDERDGHVYKTVKIGEQIWMTENLNYAYPKQDSSSDSVSWCYNNEPDSCAKYGRLYTWEASMDCYTKHYSNCSIYIRDKTSSESQIQGICPQNWHIPSVNEWDTLLGLLNNFTTDLKPANGWLDGDNDSNNFEFSILPAGMLYDCRLTGLMSECETLDDQGNYISRFWDYIGQETCFWAPNQSTDMLSDLGPITYYENAFASCFSKNNKVFSSGYYEKAWAFSVRCVKDNGPME